MTVALHGAIRVTCMSAASSTCWENTFPLLRVASWKAVFRVSHELVLASVNIKKSILKFLQVLSIDYELGLCIRYQKKFVKLYLLRIYCVPETLLFFFFFFLKTNNLNFRSPQFCEGHTILHFTNKETELQSSKVTYSGSQTANTRHGFPPRL